MKFETELIPTFDLLTVEESRRGASSLYLLKGLSGPAHKKTEEVDFTKYSIELTEDRMGVALVEQSLSKSKRSERILKKKQLIVSRLEVQDYLRGDAGVVTKYRGSHSHIIISDTRRQDFFRYELPYKITDFGESLFNKLIVKAKLPDQLTGTENLFHRGNNLGKAVGLGVVDVFNIFKKHPSDHDVFVSTTRYSFQNDPRKEFFEANFKRRTSTKNARGVAK